MPTPKTPLLTADCVVFSKQKVLVVKRKFEPFKGRFALPGGFVNVGETVEDACKREVKEETRIKVSDLRLVGVYSDIRRDPRGHIVTVAYMSEVKAQEPKAGDDAASAEFVEWRKVKLAFDHRKIIKDALKITKKCQ